MACFSQRARKAVAVEYNPTYCAKLWELQAEQTRAGLGGFEVQCDDFRAVDLRQAEYITWWQQTPLTNEAVLGFLRHEYDAGRLSRHAVAVPLADLKWQGNRDNLHLERNLTAWHLSVPFNEKALCERTAPHRYELRHDLLSSRQSKTPCFRAYGTFVVSGIPILNVPPKWEAMVAEVRARRTSARGVFGWLADALHEAIEGPDQGLYRWQPNLRADQSSARRMLTSPSLRKQSGSEATASSHVKQQERPFPVGEREENEES